MNLNTRELNELIYCIGIARMHGQLLGTTVADKLEVKLRNELDAKLEWNLIGNAHTVSNADEFPNSVKNEFYDYVETKERGWITQALLDYVDNRGAVSHGDLERYYKILTGGSNSFSHILDSLRTPYKNRKTQRYLAKEGKKGSNAKYVVKIAEAHNWIVKN
jgi:hypothetical protein